MATAPRIPPAWGTGLVPARARVAGSGRSGFGPSPLQHATPPRLRSPRDSQALSPPCNSVTLSTMQLRENNSLSRLPVQTLSGQPPGPPKNSPFESSLASHLVRTQHSLKALNPLCPPFSNRGPVFSPAPLRAPSRTSSKGACHLAFPSPRPVRGTRESASARSQGKPAYHYPFFLPRLHPPRGDRDHTVLVRWRGVSIV